MSPLEKPFGAGFYRPFFPDASGDFDLPVDVVSCGYGHETSLAYRWDNDRHRRRPAGEREQFVVQWTLNGAGEFTDLGGPAALTRTVGPGEFFVASDARPYSYGLGNAASWSFYWMTLAGSACAELLAPWTRSPDGSIPLAVGRLSPNGTAVTSWQTLLAEARAGGPADRWRLSALGYLFLTQLRASRDQNDGFAVAVRDEATRFVTADFARASVASLAAHFGYTRGYFHAYFLEATGSTPHRFVQRLRIDHAKVLLATTGLAVGEVAARCGFGDANHFSRLFSAEVGLAPSRYAKGQPWWPQLTIAIPVNSAGFSHTEAG